MPILTKKSKIVTALLSPLIVEALTDTTDSAFTFEDLQLLVDDYRDQTEELGDAKVTTVDGCIALTVMDKADSGVAVYYAKNEPGLFETIDKKYLELIASDRSTYNDFWDRWTAVIDTFEPCKIVDEVFFE